MCIASYWNVLPEMCVINFWFHLTFKYGRTGYCSVISILPLQNINGAGADKSHIQWRHFIFTYIMIIWMIVRQVFELLFVLEDFFSSHRPLHADTSKHCSFVCLDSVGNGLVAVLMLPSPLRDVCRMKFSSCTLLLFYILYLLTFSLFQTSTLSIL